MRGPFEVGHDLVLPGCIPKTSMDSVKQHFAQNKSKAHFHQCFRVVSSPLLEITALWKPAETWKWWCSSNSVNWVNIPAVNEYTRQDKPTVNISHDSSGTSCSMF